MSVGAICSARRSSVPLLCFIRTSVSDGSWSECPSAAIMECHHCMATTRNGALVGRFSLPETQAPCKITAIEHFIGGCAFSLPNCIVSQIESHGQAALQGITLPLKHLLLLEKVEAPFRRKAENRRLLPSSLEMLLLSPTFSRRSADHL